MMPYLAAVPGFSSTLSLTIFTLPLSSLEISSSAGPIIRQGPHHSAQKSTTTGVPDFRTSVSNEPSVTFAVAMGASREDSGGEEVVSKGRNARRSRQGREDSASAASRRKHRRETLSLQDRHDPRQVIGPRGSLPVGDHRFQVALRCRLALLGRQFRQRLQEPVQHPPAFQRGAALALEAGEERAP